MSDRFCRDCRHAEREDDGRSVRFGGRCLHLLSRQQRPNDPVTGEPSEIEYLQMKYLRAMAPGRHYTVTGSDVRGHQFCGTEGAWWEPLFANLAALAVWADQVDE
jgi:hypothetical protein